MIYINIYRSRGMPFDKCGAHSRSPQLYNFYGVLIFRYLKVLVQEMGFTLDLGFLVNVANLFGSVADKLPEVRCCCLCTLCVKSYPFLI